MESLYGFIDLWFIDLIHDASASVSNTENNSTFCTCRNGTISLLCFFCFCLVLFRCFYLNDTLLSWIKSINPYSGSKWFTCCVFTICKCGCGNSFDHICLFVDLFCPSSNFWNPRLERLYLWYAGTCLEYLVHVRTLRSSGHKNVTCIFWRCTSIPKTKFLRRAFQNLKHEHDGETDRQRGTQAACKFCWVHVMCICFFSEMFCDFVSYIYILNALHFIFYGHSSHFTFTRIFRLSLQFQDFHVCALRFCPRNILWLLCIAKCGWTEALKCHSFNDITRKLLLCVLFLLPFTSFIELEKFTFLHQPPQASRDIKQLSCPCLVASCPYMSIMTSEFQSRLSHIPTADFNELFKMA